VVTRNGIRLQPPEGIEWFGNGLRTSYGLPTRGNYQQIIINAETDIKVWVDNVLQVQSSDPLTGDYRVSDWNGSNVPGRQVIFNVPPTEDSRILITVSTIANYSVTGSQLRIITGLNADDILAITTWNDTSQQNILTQVFNGPVVTGDILQDPFDTVPFDVAVVSNTSGSYDFSEGTVIASNEFFLARADIVATRLWVTLDGARLFSGIDFSIREGQLILSSGTIKSDSVLVVTEFTNSVVPESMAFRIFQDMRGIQATYRISINSSTKLTQPLAANGQVIHVEKQQSFYIA
jgi:hypothetical protein